MPEPFKGIIAMHSFFFGRVCAFVRESLAAAFKITSAEPLYCPKKASRDRPLRLPHAALLRRILGIAARNQPQNRRLPNGKI
jgi:hypothetical protein